MKFSVLMSVYKNDNPEFFREALKSVSINQIVKPSQIVVVEDGPVDKTFDDIIKEVEKQSDGIEYTIIKLKKNKGLATALNEGIKVCKFDWIARMDSDDVSTKDRFKKQVDYLKSHSKVKVLGGAIAEFKNTPGDIVSERHVGASMKDIVKMARSRTPMNHVSVMYKKDAVEKAGYYSENFGKLEDYKLWVDMISNKIYMANLNDVIVFVRVGNGFIERRSNKREIKDWDMLQKYLLKSNIIGKFQALKNRIYIRVFTYMPSWLKSIAYKIVLRKTK